MTAPPTPEPEVFGPYLLYERLGAGGMAVVHRAVRTGSDGFQRPCALKRLLPQHAGDQEFVKGFVREARLASRLSHPNIAQTFDLGRVDLTYYIAMELVEGADLRALLRHIAHSVGPLPMPVALNVLSQVCEALDYAHSFADDKGKPIGIVHRDISPSNLIVGRDGMVKIIDFGIAKASTATLHTASGMLKGKFSYMAPEMLEGQLDARSDLFSLGVVMWELLTARPLFRGDTDFDTLEQIKRMEAPPPSQFNRKVPPAMDAVVAKTLAKKPAQRWSTAGEIRQALHHVASSLELWATNLEVARWIEWARAQPTRAQPWDAGGGDDVLELGDSVMIELGGGTQMGAPPGPRPSGGRATGPTGLPALASPAAPAGVPAPGPADPVESGRVRTLMGEGAAAPTAQSRAVDARTTGPTAALAPKQTMLAWGGALPGAAGSRASGSVPAVGASSSGSIPLPASLSSSGSVPALGAPGSVPAPGTTGSVPALGAPGAKPAPPPLATLVDADHVAPPAGAPGSRPQPPPLATMVDADRIVPTAPGLEAAPPTMVLEGLPLVAATPGRAAAGMPTPAPGATPPPAMPTPMPTPAPSATPAPPAARAGGSSWIVLVVLLCAAVAVGSYFVVQAVL